MNEEAHSTSDQLARYLSGEADAAERQAVEAWAKRQATGSKVGRIDALRFADSLQLNKLIEEMKALGDRVGAPTL